MTTTPPPVAHCPWCGSNNCLSANCLKIPVMVASGGEHLHGEPERKGTTDNNASSPNPQSPVASPAFESADIKTVLRALKWMRIYEEANAVFGDDVVGKAEAALTRLSARQAAFDTAWYHDELSKCHHELDKKEVALKAVVAALRAVMGALDNIPVSANEIYPDEWEMAEKALALADAEMKGER